MYDAFNITGVAPAVLGWIVFLVGLMLYAAYKSPKPPKN